MRYALSLVSAHVPLAAAAGPLFAVLDAVATRMRRSPFRPTTPTSGEELTVDAIVDYAPQFIPGAALRPDYDRGSLKWLLDLAEQKVSSGDLRKVLVRNADHEVVGWYLYYLKRGGDSDVLQIAGRHDGLGPVLEHLFSNAWRGGAVAVSGRLEPRFFDDLRARHCLFHGRGSPVLVHSRRRELVDAVRCGDAVVTRLDGEWWMCFQDGVS